LESSKSIVFSSAELIDERNRYMNYGKDKKLYLLILNKQRNMSIPQPLAGRIKTQLYTVTI